MRVSLARPSHTFPRDGHTPTLRKIIEPGSEEGIIMLPRDYDLCTITLSPQDGASATMFLTTSDTSNIEQGEAQWLEWERGRITVPSWISYSNPWRAIRIDCDGPVVVEILPQFR